MNSSDRRGPGLRILVVVALVAVVAACGGSASSSIDYGAPDIQQGGGGAMPAASAAAATAAPAEAPVAGVDGEGVVRNGGDSGSQPAILRDNLRIVYTGSLDLVVDDLAASLAKARTAILATGGYIGASQESNDGDRSTAVITYRIPASRWEDGVSALRGLATKVVGEQTQATEVGAQLVDLEARIRNLRASEQVLVEIAKGTGKVTDLLEVQDRISMVRGEIEQLDAQRSQLADQVSYGTLVTTFGLEVAQVQEAKQGWDPARDVDGASATLIAAGQTLVSAAIWFGIVWLPVILLVLVLALIARWLFRRFVPTAKPAEPIAGWGGGEG
jgi:hypothetical protein